METRSLFWNFDGLPEDERQAAVVLQNRTMSRRTYGHYTVPNEAPETAVCGNSNLKQIFSNNMLLLHKLKTCTGATLTRRQ